MSVVAIAGGARLDVERIGARGGAPILLLRPLGGSMTLWGDFAARLAEVHDLIAFDPRGVGRSSRAPLATTTRAIARDARALLDALGVVRAHVFGESLGGMAASWLAHDEPARVARVVLASTVPDAGALSRRGAARLAGAARCLARPMPEAERCLIARILSRELSPERRAAIDRAVDESIRVAPMRRRDLIALALAAGRHRAPRLRLPALLLFGDRDPIAGRASRAELLRDCPAGEVELIAGAGHALTLERPRETAERVLAFVGPRSR